MEAQCRKILTTQHNTTQQLNKNFLKKSAIGLFSTLSLLSFFSSTAFAGGPDPMASPQLPPPAKTHWEVFGGAGYINYLSGTQMRSFNVSSIETDTLSQVAQNNSFGYTLGFDKIYYLSCPHIQAISMGLTLRYDPANFGGDVYQFQDPTMNNYTYNYFVRPISALFETNVLLHRFRKIHTSPFIIVGAGLSVVNLTYQETPTPSAVALGVPVSSGANTSNWTTTPDVAVGAGLKFNLKKGYFLKAQYLYQYRGTYRLNNPLSIQGVPVNLDEQSADVIAGYQFK